jgi:toxin CcdB
VPQFDVHRLPDSGGFVIDCQSDLHDHFDSRMVVPLVPVERAGIRISRLHPSIVVSGSEFVMATHLATAVPKRELSRPIANLADRRLEIIGAIDVLITGV